MKGGKWRPRDGCHVRREQVQNGAAGTRLLASGAEQENGNHGIPQFPFPLHSTRGLLLPTVAASLGDT